MFDGSTLTAREQNIASWVDCCSLAFRGSGIVHVLRDFEHIAYFQIHEASIESVMNPSKRNYQLLVHNGDCYVNANVHKLCLVGAYLAAAIRETYKNCDDVHHELENTEIADWEDEPMGEYFGSPSEGERRYVVDILTDHWESIVREAQAAIREKGFDPDQI